MGRLMEIQGIDLTKSAFHTTSVCSQASARSKCRRDTIHRLACSRSGMLDGDRRTVVGGMYILYVHDDDSDNQTDDRAGRSSGLRGLGYAC